MSVNPISGSFSPAASMGAGAAPTSGGGSEAKIKELEKKLLTLKEEKKQAENNHDAEKVKELEEEIRKVEKELEELKRKAKKEEEKEGGEEGGEGRPPSDGVTGQYLNTWA